MPLSCNPDARFKKVYGGLNWTPDARAPLTAPGVEVKAGEYLLAVRGVDLKPPTEIYSLFENTADKSMEITVGPNPDGKDSRTVTVEPVANESALRNADWVDGHRKNDRDDRGHLLYGRDSVTNRDNNVHLRADKLSSDFGVALSAPVRPAILDRDVAVLDPAQFAEMRDKSRRPWTKSGSICA